jgi:hypothetical protein
VSGKTGRQANDRFDFASLRTAARVDSFFRKHPHAINIIAAPGMLSFA